MPNTYRKSKNPELHFNYFPLKKQQKMCRFNISIFNMAEGLPSQKAQIVDTVKPTLIISLGEQEISLTTKIEATTTTSILKINEEVDEQLAALMVVKSYITFEKDEFTIYSTGPQGEKGKRHFDFFDDGLIMTLSSEDVDVPVAKRFFRRIREINIESNNTIK